MEAWLQLGGSERAIIMADGRRLPARSRCDCSRQTIELGFWTPTDPVVAAKQLAGAEAVLPLGAGGRPRGLQGGCIRRRRNAASTECKFVKRGQTTFCCATLEIKVVCPLSTNLRPPAEATLPASRP